MQVKRLPKILRTLPDPPKRKGAAGWYIEDQFIVDSKGDVICQWGSYTTRRNAELICQWSRKRLKKRS